MNKKQLRKKLALMLANLKKKRKFFCEVEYLESDGIDLMYINPELAYFPDFEVGVKCDSNSDRNATLGIDSNNMLERYSSSSPYWTLHASGTIFGSNVGVGTYADAKYKDGVFSVNEITFGTKENTFPSGDLFLFKPSATNNTLYKMSIYFFKAWDNNGVLVRDFIPVLDWDMTPCMYDKVSGELFYNQGTGDFSYGREIHYVDYLESTGTQYIDTEYAFTDGFSWEIDFEGISDGTTLFGGRTSSTRTALLYQRNYGGIDKTTCPIAGYNGQETPFQLTDLRLGRHTIKMSVASNEGSVWVDGVQSYNEQSFSGSYVSGTTQALFADKFGNNDYREQTSSKVYGLKMWQGSTLVRDYLPAIDENGVGFMFDRVSHTIYDNAGTGAFGYSGREVEYLQSDGARAILADVTVDDTCGYDVKWMALNANDTIIMGTKGSGDSRWVLSGSNNPTVNISWNTSFGRTGLGLNKIQTAQMNYFNDRKRILNDIPLEDITTTLSSAASTYNVGIFGGYWGASTISLYSTCRIYYAKITKGTELIRDFIPMVKDGSPCLYDKVGGEYYFGIGNGSFTTGKILEPEYE